MMNGWMGGSGWMGGGMRIGTVVAVRVVALLVVVISKVSAKYDCISGSVCAAERRIGTV